MYTLSFKAHLAKFQWVFVSVTFYLHFILLLRNLKANFNHAMFSQILILNMQIRLILYIPSPPPPKKSKTKQNQNKNQWNINQWAKLNKTLLNGPWSVPFLNCIHWPYTQVSIKDGPHRWKYIYMYFFNGHGRAI